MNYIFTVKWEHSLEIRLQIQKPVKQIKWKCYSDIHISIILWIWAVCESDRSEMRVCGCDNVEHISSSNEKFSPYMYVMVVWLWSLLSCDVKNEIASRFNPIRNIFLTEFSFVKSHWRNYSILSEIYVNLWDFKNECESKIKSSTSITASSIVK